MSSDKSGEILLVRCVDGSQCAQRGTLPQTGDTHIPSANTHIPSVPSVPSRASRGALGPLGWSFLCAWVVAALLVRGWCAAS